MSTKEVLNAISKCLVAEHGELVHVQIYGLPKRFWQAISRCFQSSSLSVTHSQLPGGGWMVFYEVPNRDFEKLSVTRAAFFRNEGGKLEKTWDVILRDGSENYPLSPMEAANAAEPKADWPGAYHQGAAGWTIAASLPSWWPFRFGRRDR